MARFAKAICTLHSLTGLPEDECVNVMHFEGDDSQTWAEDADDLAGRIFDFYNATDAYLSGTLSGRLDVQIYDMSEPTPRVPKYEQTWTTLSVGAGSMPTEVALCISFEAAQVSGENQARRRGRIYFGPLYAAASTVVGSRATPNAAMIAVIGAAFANMVIGPDPGDFRLAVYSPTTFLETASLASSFNDVTTVWMDNAWDTQRRRGTQPMIRTTWPAA